MKRVIVAALAGCVAFAPVGAFAKSKSGTGMASYYKTGKRTANGEHYNPMGMTAAHRSLPFGTRVLVTNLKTGKSVVVRINDRGPFIRGRVIDLSYGAALAVDLHRSGVAQIRYVILG